MCAPRLGGGAQTGKRLRAEGDFGAVFAVKEESTLARQANTCVRGRQGPTSPGSTLDLSLPWDLQVVDPDWKMLRGLKSGGEGGGGGSGCDAGVLWAPGSLGCHLWAVGSPRGVSSREATGQNLFSEKTDVASF